MKLYEKFAGELIELIRNGTLKGSEKLPSIRKASQLYGISQATVITAYYLLETQGIIYSKERSGFYIKPIFNHTLKPPKKSYKTAKETTVEVSDFIFSTLRTVKNPDTVQFGSAFPHPKLFPIAELTQSMHKSLQALQQTPHELISDMTTGNHDLIRQIELRYMLGGVALKPNELVITNGAMEALSLSLQAVTQAGDLVAIESPVFYAILQILERLQLKAIEIPVDPDHGMDIQFLETSLKKFKIKAVVLMTSFQNPLGATLSAHQQEQLMQLVYTHQLPIIVDDVYAELYFGKTAPISLKSLDEFGLVLHCNSFSKCLAPGYRVGWVAGGIFADKIERLKLMATISPSVPAQLAIAHYLKNRHYDRHLQKLRYVLAISQQKMLVAITQYFPKDIAVTEPRGGYFLWIELNKKVDTLILYKQALEYNISIAPGPIFSVAQKFKHCIRLNYGMEWQVEHENAIKRLGQLIQGLTTAKSS